MTFSADLIHDLSCGESISAELPAARPGHRRYVVVRSFRHGWMNQPGYWELPWRYRVFAYGVKAELVEEHLSLGMLEDFREATLDDLKALQLLLDEWAPLAKFRNNREVVAPY
jgi:hypothetical protein